MREGFVIRQSESGDWFIVPEENADTFFDDELEGEAFYATYVDLNELVIFDFEV